MRSQASSFWVVLVCCVAVAAAQTFQYSRGWNSGRKRAAAAAAIAGLAQPQQLQQRARVAELAVKRAAAILEDAGLMLVPAAACDSTPLAAFHLLRRTARQDDEAAEGAARGQEALVAPQSQQTAADPESTPGGTAFSF